MLQVNVEQALKDKGENEMANKAIELLKKYIDNYTAENQHETSPAMIKFHLRDYHQAIAKIEQLQADIERMAIQIDEQNKEIRGLKEQPRCPCGGELEGLGYDIKTKDEVWECKKCYSQVIVKEALKDKP